MPESHFGCLIAATVLEGSAEIGDRPTAMHVRGNTIFELCENSASRAPVAAATACVTRLSLHCCAEVRHTQCRLNLDSTSGCLGGRLPKNKFKNSEILRIFLICPGGVTHNPSKTKGEYEI